MDEALALSVHCFISFSKVLYSKQPLEGRVGIFVLSEALEDRDNVSLRQMTGRFAAQYN